MENSTTHDYLVRLRDVILKERTCATNLDMEGLMEAMQAKDELVQVLSHVEVIDERDQMIATQVRQENRRNAFLFKSTLGWIRNTMEFFGKTNTTSTYSSSAGTVSSQVNGRLLSGRV